MDAETIQIVDRGRGLQLSTSRITVQDLVPYFQEGCSLEEIIRWIPTLTAAEIAVVERYYREHQPELHEEDRQIRAHVAEQVRLQRLRFPEEPREVRLARMKEALRQRQQERNGPVQFFEANGGVLPPGAKATPRPAVRPRELQPDGSASASFHLFENEVASSTSKATARPRPGRPEGDGE